MKERFWSKVNKSGLEPSHVKGLGVCWLWEARRDSRGYGQFRIDSRTVRAHRVSFFLSRGYWPSPCCCHACDNPSCVRPEHLFEGTDADNAADRDRKGRGRYEYRRGDGNPNAKLTSEDVVLIRRALQSGETQRRIAARFGVSNSMIGNIKRMENWQS